MTQGATQALTAEQRAGMTAKLTALADDELILSHRNGEWIGHAPILEEDIALANLAQDELGHAGIWLGLRQQLDGSDPDRLAYFREAGEYRNARLLELPRGDWAFTLLRQFLFDAYETVWLQAARASAYRPLAEAADKIVREERFHLQHTRLWVERLGLGTGESNRRIQQALNEQWPHAAQLFEPVEGEQLLVQAGMLPDLRGLLESWRGFVTGHLTSSGLSVPGWPDTPPAGRGEHTEHLRELLSEMQEVARWDPQAEAW